MGWEQVKEGWPCRTGEPKRHEIRGRMKFKEICFNRLIWKPNIRVHDIDELRWSIQREKSTGLTWESLQVINHSYIWVSHEWPHFRPFWLLWPQSPIPCSFSYMALLSWSRAFCNWLMLKLSKPHPASLSTCPHLQAMDWKWGLPHVRSPFFWPKGQNSSSPILPWVSKSHVTAQGTGHWYLELRKWLSLLSFLSKG